MRDRYEPPYRITPGILHSIEQIGEALGNLRAHSAGAIVPILRRGNRIKTIQASLAIEGNTLSLEQVTAIIAGKRVLALPREIKEVRNTFAAYEELPNWSTHSRTDLLAAHRLMMAGLVDETGRFRSGDVGIQRGEKVVHAGTTAFIELDVRRHSTVIEQSTCISDHVRDYLYLSLKCYSLHDIYRLCGI